MTAAAHCDRCGCSLPEPAARAPGARLLCASCRAVAGEANTAPGKASPVSAALAALLVAAAAGWIGWRLVSLESRLAGLAKAKPAAAPEPPFSPEETQALKRLAARPSVTVEELASLKEDLAKLRDVVKRPGIPAALTPMPPVPSPAPAPAPVQPPAPPKEDPAPSLTRDLSSADPMARYQALALVQKPEEAAAAVRLLQDDMGFVRRGAAEALGRLKLAQTVPHLVAMARKEQDLLAKRAALEALEKITGVACVKPGADEAAALKACEAWQEAHP